MTMRPRSVRTIKGDIGFAKVFYPERLLELEVELADAELWADENRRPKREAIENATHVRLVDGWAEVVSVEKSSVLVAVGEHPARKVSCRDVLEVKSL